MEIGRESKSGAMDENCPAGEALRTEGGFGKEKNGLRQSKDPRSHLPDGNGGGTKSGAMAGKCPAGEALRTDGGFR